MADGIDMAMDSMRERLVEIKAKISQCRKKGFYTKIAELKIAEIPSKIKLLEVTREVKEVARINTMLEDAKAEIESVQAEGEALGVAKDVDKAVDRIADSVDSAWEELKYNNINKAKGLYSAAVGGYSSLPDERKKEVREGLERLRNKLS